MPPLKSAVGETRVMKNGLSATVVRYRNATDIDVLFEDGKLVPHRAMSAFRSGTIAHPTINAKSAKSSCLGETRMMKNGQKATCIEYRDSKNVTLRFEDGTVVANKSKREFYMGTAGNPSIGTRITQFKPIVGQKKIMNCGLEAEVIADRNSQDIDVRFEDGVIVRHRGRADFRRRNISHPRYVQNSFPQQLILFGLKDYFPDAVANCRPPFLKNASTGHNLELDVWIPSVRAAFEYDGFPWHKCETEVSLAKYKAIVASEEIKTVYTFVETGCIEHQSPKHRNFHIDVDFKKIRKNANILYEQIRQALIQILGELGVKNPICHIVRNTSMKSGAGPTKSTLV